MLKFKLSFETNNERPKKNKVLDNATFKKFTCKSFRNAITTGEGCLSISEEY